MSRREFIQFMALHFLLALSIVLTAIFTNAVIAGGETVVKINEYGEMIPELLILFFVVWPVIGTGYYVWMNREL